MGLTEGRNRRTGELETEFNLNVDIALVVASIRRVAVDFANAVFEASMRGTKRVSRTHPSSVLECPDSDAGYGVRIFTRLGARHGS